VRGRSGGREIIISASTEAAGAGTLWAYVIARMDRIEEAIVGKFWKLEDVEGACRASSTFKIEDERSHIVIDPAEDTFIYRALHIA
jgi:hypothetical protein